MPENFPGECDDIDRENCPAFLERITLRAELAAATARAEHAEGLASDLGAEYCDDCGKLADCPITSEMGNFCEACYARWKYQCAKCSYRTDDIDDSDLCPKCGALLRLRTELDRKE